MNKNLEVLRKIDNTKTAKEILPRTMTGKWSHELEDAKDLKYIKMTLSPSSSLSEIDGLIFHKDIKRMVDNYINSCLIAHKANKNVLPSLSITGTSGMGKKTLALYIQQELKKLNIETLVEDLGKINQDDLLLFEGKLNSGVAVISYHNLGIELPSNSSLLKNDIFRITLFPQYFLVNDVFKDLFRYALNKSGFQGEIEDSLILKVKKTITGSFNLHNLFKLISNLKSIALTNNLSFNSELLNKWVHESFINLKDNLRLALPFQEEKSINDFIDLCYYAKKHQQSSPTLIIYGPQGVGKRHVAEYVSQMLDKHDISPLIVPMTANQPDYAITLEYVKRSQEGLLGKGKHPIILIIPTPSAEKTDEFLNRVDYFNQELKQISHTTTLILNHHSFNDEVVFSDLVKSILKDHEFSFNHRMFDTVVSVIQKKLLFKTPSNIDSIITPIALKAKINNAVFNTNYLIHELADLRNIKPPKTNEFGAIISQRKVSFKDTEYSDEFIADFNQIIFEAKTLKEMEKFEFINKMRPYGQKMALFLYGEPGTGKSLAAEVLACELNKPLWTIDLSMAMGMYVGETEKYLTKLFNEAEKQEVVLRFDEASSLLGSRSQDKSSYEKRWVNHLLNLIEDYRGIIICTDNYYETIDEAFKRRFNHKLEVKVPSKEKMKSMIEKMLYPDAPLSQDFDLNKALENVPAMSGGYIRNALERAFKIAYRNNKGLITTEILNTALVYEGRGKGKNKRIGLS